jgi:hypothetical protein
VWQGHRRQHRPGVRRRAGQHGVALCGAENASAQCARLRSTRGSHAHPPGKRSEQSFQ